MQPQNAAKAATGVSRCDLRITNRLAGAIGEKAYNERHAARQRLVRLTAKIDALCVWRDDIQARIEHAKQLFERGALYQDQLDDITDAVKSWRLAAATVALDTNPQNCGIVRRAD